jgi:hypothetical protein
VAETGGPAEAAPAVDGRPLPGPPPAVNGRGKRKAQMRKVRPSVTHAGPVLTQAWHRAVPNNFPSSSSKWWGTSARVPPRNRLQAGLNHGRLNQDHDGDVLQAPRRSIRKGGAKTLQILKTINFLGKFSEKISLFSENVHVTWLSFAQENMERFALKIIFPKRG